jgi:hypothetical protein
MRVFLQDGTVIDAGAEEWVVLELSDRDKLNIQAMNVGNSFFATFPEGMKRGQMQDILEDIIQTASLRDKGLIITKGQPGEADNEADTEGDTGDGKSPGEPEETGEMTDKNSDTDAVTKPDNGL